MEEKRALKDLSDEDLQKEYNRQAVQSGDLTYKVHCYQEDISIAHKIMREINLVMWGRKQEHKEVIQ